MLMKDSLWTHPRFMGGGFMSQGYNGRLIFKLGIKEGA